MPFPDDVNRLLRDHQGYTGDGQGGSGALPIGDTSTANRPISKRDLRELFLTSEGASVTAIAAADEAVAAAAEATGAVYTFGTVASLVASSQAFTVGAIILTRSERFAFEVVASGPDLTTAGSVLLRALPDARGWLDAAQFGAVGDGVTDDRAAVQAAVNRIASNGGGWLAFGPKTYRIASSSIYAGVESGPTVGTLTARNWVIGLQVPAGVSLRGVKGKTVLDFSTAAGIDTGLGTVEYANGTIRDLEIVGAGSTGNTAHGVFNTFVSDGTHVKEDVTFQNLHIHGWGSYGIGCGYGQPVDNLYRNILIEDVGADGIDHKVRFGPNDPNWDGCSNTRFEGVTIRNHGNRVTSTSGIDVRGPVSLSQIQVLDVRDACFGITLSAGIAQGADEVRTPSARTVLSNFKIEGADPDSNIIGINCLSGGPAVVSDGYVHWCRTGVKCGAATASPSSWRDSQTISNVIVEGARGGTSFLLDNDRAHLIGCRSIADVQYFDEKRGFVIAGETTFPIEGGIGSGSVVVLRNGVQLTGGGVDYNLVSGSVVLTAALVGGDELIVAVTTNIAVDVNGSYCSVVGGGNDEFHSGGISYTATSINTSAAAGYVDEAGVNILLRTNLGMAGIIPSGSDADIDLQLRAKGSGQIKLSGLPTASAGLDSTAIWVDGGFLRLA